MDSVVYLSHHITGCNVVLFSVAESNLLLQPTSLVLAILHVRPVELS